MLKTIDLFAGAGGLSYGFLQTGQFQLVAAAELNKNAQATYKANIANHVPGFVFIDNVVGYDFAKLNEELGGIDIVIGGPPCQGFSQANRQKNHLISMNNGLVKEFFRAIKEIKPVAFVMENVSMLRSDKHRFYESSRDYQQIEDLIAQGSKLPKRLDTLLIAPMVGRNNWSEAETILAFFYYCQIPFGKIHKENLEIQRIASLIGRTPSAVVFKMGNLGHFDPELQKRNVSGLKNASKLDSIVVNKFINDWESLSLQASIIEANLEQGLPADYRLAEILPEGNDRLVEAKARVNQDFFREAVLSSYGNRCCITGISEIPLLVASHIKPWKDSDTKTERTNPSNGLCLNALHDKAFDRGFITVLPDLSIRVSSKLTGQDSGTLCLRQCDKKTIAKPKRFLPAREFLEYHNDVIFVP